MTLRIWCLLTPWILMTWKICYFCSSAVSVFLLRMELWDRSRSVWVNWVQVVSEEVQYWVLVLDVLARGAIESGHHHQHHPSQTHLQSTNQSDLDCFLHFGAQVLEQVLVGVLE